MLERTLDGKTILLVICGGIAAYKSLDLIRRLKERGAKIIPVLTQSAEQFITPLSVGALSASKVYSDLFDRDDEIDVGHIRLARMCDLIVIAPCTANFAAKMAHGIASDLASTLLLATDKPVLIAPAMNPAMWDHAATERNFKQLIEDGIKLIGPMNGEMAESGEAGIGRMAEPMEIVGAVEKLFSIQSASLPLTGKQILVTAGPTHEPIDPVRYIANRSSGKQGYAIAEQLAQAGAEVTLISGPTNLKTPKGVQQINVETAQKMYDAVEAQLPCDAAFFVAAVADWRAVNIASEKIKKDKSSKATPAPLVLLENPDILASVGNHTNLRPELVVGFAAETQNIQANAQDKLASKGADWIVANDVSEQTGVMGGDNNQVHLITKNGNQAWPQMTKNEVAIKLTALVIEHFHKAKGS